MQRYVLSFQQIDRSQIALGGGKGANLGELSRIDGVIVPGGICVTTGGYERVLAAASLGDQLNRLSQLRSTDREAIRDLSAEIRAALENAPIPDELVREVRESLASSGEETPYAVRSSATAEDLPTASFAGQQDTFLNVVGAAAILGSVRRCWASLFTERAVTYRLRNGIDQRKVRMAVVVQRMVFPQSSGVLFTADPITGHRKVSSIEATFGLGEALVLGIVNPDGYKVREGEIIARSVGRKTVSVQARPGGGTGETRIDDSKQEQPALADEQIVRLADLGRTIEAYFGHPQDIEWCLMDGDFQIVQSRPITTLFPIPARGDEEYRVYLSVGHQQMMTDPHTPLGISIRQMTAGPVMHEAGGRLFVEVTQALASPVAHQNLLAMVSRSDPLTGDALETILDRGDFGTLPAPAAPLTRAGPPAGAPSPIATDPRIVTELIRRSEESVSSLERAIASRSGSDLLEFMLTDFQELKRVLFDPQSSQVIMAGMDAAWWLNDQLDAWLGETNAADTLTLSVPDNITAQMGMELLDVADVVRPHPEVVSFLEEATDGNLMRELPGLPGGLEVHDALHAFLAKHGMRCVGEIEISHPRWLEAPTTLLPILLANVRNFGPGASARKFEEGRERAWRKEEELMKRLRALPDGEAKASQTRRMIDRVRTFAGYREYPKYGMISRYFIYRQALMGEAERLLQEGVIMDKEEIFFLTFAELQELVRTRLLDRDLVRQRKEAFVAFQGLTPPRVLTSHGEALSGAYRREDAPAGALVGVAVSLGTIEGRARVVLDICGADLEPGDILVTRFTDPSWTPAFVGIAGLVTEIGGSMTHGAVIAREYGLPAVVSVPDATRLIRDGATIRVNGTHGYVEILD